MKGGAIILSEIPSKLCPALKPIEEMDEFDSNYGLPSHWVKVVVHLLHGPYKPFNLPRILWLRKNWNL